MQAIRNGPSPCDGATNAPIEITEAHTQTLEELIRQRCVDGVWDDVVRKAAPNERALNEHYNRREQPLSEEKSKVGLGELYAQEYEKQLARAKAAEARAASLKKFGVNADAAGPDDFNTGDEKLD